MMPYYLNRSTTKDWIPNIQVSQVDTDSEIFVNNWARIDETLHNLNWSNCVLVVDNLYTSTNREIQDNHDLSRLLQEIHRIKSKYNLTMILIGHSNKGVALFSTDNFTVSSGAVTIKDQGVANAELANMAANTVKVRDANSSGVPSDKAVGNGEILIGDGTGFTAAAPSSDVSMTNAGAFTVTKIQGNAISSNSPSNDQ